DCLPAPRHCSLDRVAKALDNFMSVATFFSARMRKVREAQWGHGGIGKLVRSKRRRMSQTNEAQPGVFCANQKTVTIFLRFAENDYNIVNSLQRNLKSRLEWQTQCISLRL